jgi:predicted flavoprotein YhiN
MPSVYANTKLPGISLKKKLINAIPDRNTQIELHDAFSSKQDEHVAGWTKMIKDWEAEISGVNPYERAKSRTYFFIST